MYLHNYYLQWGAEYEALLYHTEVRWLSKGQVLKRLFSGQKFHFCAKEKGTPLLEYFARKNYINGLS
jgi:hypothetical protein